MPDNDVHMRQKIRNTFVSNNGEERKRNVEQYPLLDHRKRKMDYPHPAPAQLNLEHQFLN